MSVVAITSASPLLSFKQLGRLCQATFSTSAPRMCASRWASACQPSSVAQVGQRGRPPDRNRDTIDGPRVPSCEGIFLLRRSLLALMLALAVTACGGDDNPNGPSTPPPQGPATLVI